MMKVLVGIFFLIVVFLLLKNSAGAGSLLSGPGSVGEFANKYTKTLQGQ